jgi:Pyruvate/2-oxoacid:ferredoxin oxidoreductase delta subunit
VLIVPHIYYLADGHPALERLAKLQGQLVLASWLHPRPAYWTLRALGIHDASGTGDDPAPRQARGGLSLSKAAGRIHCFDLGAFPTVDACAEAMRQTAGSSAAAAESAPEEVTDAVSARWYPVLDYSCCVACGKCHDFCLFGVYSLDGERVVATEPDRCKPGCPACARLCPQGAIMFPHHAADPAIAGAPGAKMADGQADIAAFLHPDKAAEEKAERAGEPDDLDDLIDALDELDE